MEKKIERMPTKFELDNIEQKKSMISAMEVSLGILTQALKIVKIDARRHHKWMREDEDYAYEIRQIQEMCLDFAEQKLFELIRGVDRQVVTNKGDIVVIKEPPNVAAVLFYLKTKGKHRGYVERQELTGEEGRPVIQIAANI